MNKEIYDYTECPDCKSEDIVYFTDQKAWWCKACKTTFWRMTKSCKVSV